MLDNLGIMVDATSANENYAEVLGKTVSELTDAERKQAFVNEAMKEANTLVKNLGDEHLTTADKIKQAQTAMDDLKVQIGVLLTPVIENAAKAAGILAKKLRLAIDPESLRMDELRIEIARLQAHLIQMAEDPSFFDKLKNMLGGDAILMERLRLYEDMLKRLQATLSTTGNVIVSSFIPATKSQSDSVFKVTDATKAWSKALVQTAQIGKNRSHANALFAKRAAQLEAIVNTASAIVEALPNIPLSLAVGALGASQIATIEAAKFAQGGDFVTSGPQMIMVGDNPGGQERVQVTPIGSPNIEGPQGGITLNISAPLVDETVIDSIIPAIQKAQRLNLA